MNWNKKKYMINGIERFPALLKDKSDDQVDILQRQFQQYQVNKIPEGILKTKRADTQWVLIGDLLDEDTKPYKELSEVMLGILSLFHSNADCERMFSQIRKAKKECQGKLSITKLNRILQFKVLLLSSGKSCLSYQPTAEVLKACKAATYKKLHGLNSDTDSD